MFNAITGVEFCVVLSLSPYCTQLSYIFCAFFKLFRDHLMYTSLRVDRLISTKLHCQLTRLPPRPPKYFEHSLDAFRKLSCKYSCLLPKRSGKSQPMSRVKNFQPKNLEPQHPTSRVQSYNSLVLGYESVNQCIKLWHPRTQFCQYWQSYFSLVPNF